MNRPNSVLILERPVSAPLLYVSDAYSKTTTAFKSKAATMEVTAHMSNTPGVWHQLKVTVRKSDVIRVEEMTDSWWESIQKAISEKAD